MKNKSNKEIKKFITAALPYVNNQPHLGNIIGSLLSADVYARYCRKRGYDTVFISGTDEYGTATEMEAIKQKCMPFDIVKKNRQVHMNVYSAFDLSFDYFGHTHCEEHRNLVQQFFLKIINYFKQEEVSQFYCETCEQFLADRYVEGLCVCGSISNGDQCDNCGRCHITTEIKNATCKICKSSAKIKTTTHLFLELGRLKDKIKNQDTTRWSESAKFIFNEWIEKDLHSRCMTRDLKYKWGVPVPVQGFEDKVFYVWFDAPIGYLTFLKQVKDLTWLDGSDFVQFMGKDNVPFHSIMFPAMLSALKESLTDDFLVSKNKSLVEMVKNLNIKESFFKNVKLNYQPVINSTGYLTFNGKKFSKSKSIGVFGSDILEKDVGDIIKWRFYLLRRRPETKDADFNVDEFLTLVETDLVACLGNFVNRTLKFLSKKKIVISEVLKELDLSLDEYKDELLFIESIKETYNEYLEVMEQISIRRGFEALFKLCKIGNKYLQDLQVNKEKMVLGYSLGYPLVVLVGHCLIPFLPKKALKIFEQAQVENSKFPETFEIIKLSRELKNISPIFSHFTEEQKETLLSFKPVSD
ncbi:SYMC [Hepatospora eriocheir]|uniref:methionine--tRNA ligase n=1 Tax=Hepatospora eriocheir TaxID=1081669 RepID=A0A1X0QGR5_9MICR|nr:SYMC [Hepatospora eriocheir]